MNRRQFIVGLHSIFLPQQVFSKQKEIAKRQVLTIGIFPRRNIKVTYRIFSSLAEYLSEKLQLDVKIETTKTFNDFWQAVQQRKYDLVHYNQYHYIVSHLNYGYDVILKNKELGKSTIAGSIIVRKDSGFNKVSDLKGKEILFGGGRTAMQSYISAVWLLKQAGLKSGDYVEKFAINPPNTIISTYYKRAEASGSGDVVMRLDNVTKRIDISQMKILAKTKPMSHLPWAVKNDMPDEMKIKIKQELISLADTEAGRRILSEAQLDALLPATDSEYDEHRNIISDIYGPDMLSDGLK